MTDLEQRLRHDLRDLADTVPASAHPRADLERRLARGRANRWRAPALVTAAVAAVAAAVVVPVALTDRDAGGPDQVATAPPSSETRAGDAPNVLGSYDDNGVRRQVLFTLNGGDWCVSPTFAPDEQPIEATCQPIPAFPMIYPEQPELKSWVTTRSVLGDGINNPGPLPDVLVLITAAHVTRVEVGDAMGDPVPVRLVEVLPDARFYVADFPGSTMGFRYSAFDADGKMVESAIS